MADYSNFYNTGQLKWGINKFPYSVNIEGTNAPASTNTNTSSNVFYGLLGTDVKTSVQNQSLQVVHNSVTIALFMLNEIASWDLSANQITIYSTDQLPVTLMFLSTTEAQTADSRLTQISNGAVLS